MDDAFGVDVIDAECDLPEQLAGLLFGETFDALLFEVVEDVSALCEFSDNEGPVPDTEIFDQCSHVWTAFATRHRCCLRDAIFYS